jgi:hypothetical protein
VIVSNKRHKLRKLAHAGGGASDPAELRPVDGAVRTSQVEDENGPSVCAIVPASLSYQGRRPGQIRNNFSQMESSRFPLSETLDWWLIYKEA